MNPDPRHHPALHRPNGQALTMTSNGATATASAAPAKKTVEPDPYAEVTTRPLMARNGTSSRARAVHLADASAPTGWKEVGVVSNDYLLVSNAHVRQLAHEIAGRSGLRFEEARTHFDGRRFTYVMAAKEDGLVEVGVGDYVGLGLMLSNSYDASRKLEASLLVYRLACLNGMAAPSLFRRVQFKHLRTAAGWEEEVALALQMVGSAPHGLARFAQAARTLSGMRVTASRLREVRQTVLPKLPVTAWGQTLDRFLMHEELDAWGLLNAATNVLWHAERPTAATHEHNEYVTERMVAYAQGRPS